MKAPGGRISFQQCIIRILVLFFTSVCSLPGIVAAQDQYFTDESSNRLPDTAVFSLGADISDIDEDGDQDICVVTFATWGGTGPPYILINDGSGYFTGETEERMPSVPLDANYCVFGDIEWDGDNDLYVCTSTQNVIYVNYDQGHFADETDIRLPALINQTNDAAFADFTEDFDLDILAQGFYHFSVGTRLFENDGIGFFSDITFSSLPPDQFDNIFILPLDIDNDLDLDIVETCFSPDGIGQWARLLINDGGGFFSDADSSRIPVRLAQSLNAGDIDQDGDIDIIVVSGGTGVGLLINDREGYFTDETTPRMPDQGESSLATYAGIADFDNDADLDIVVASSDQRPLLFYLNNGQGYFIESNDRLPENSQSAWRVIPFDADADEDEDFFLACAGFGYQKIFINHCSSDTIPPGILGNTILPSQIDSLAFFPIYVSAADNISGAKGELSGALVFRVNGLEFIRLPLLPLGGTLYGERIPPQSIGAEIGYYIELRDHPGNFTRRPEGAPDSVYSFTIVEPNGIIENREAGYRFPHITARPNPFNSRTTISYSSAKGGEIGIYNSIGQLVSSFEVELGGAGKVIWDGTDIRGKKLASGAYFVRFNGEGRSRQIKLIYLK